MKSLRKESGYALLLMMLVLLGAGGVVLAGFTQQARQDSEEQRYLHNQRVLKEAKQALLMYAYRYPDIALTNNGTIRGPGRLPCPDIDAPGTAGAGTPNASFNCISGSAMVGRFPWNADGLEFYDVRDASGEQLWYAVSRNFANTINPAASDIINSDTLGTITLVDRSGQVLYDGAASGIAAVIVAPGPIVRRDENGDGVYEYVQVRQTAAQQADPRNYLDTFGDFDNSVFVNGSNADADGFMLGPVFDNATGDIVVNDQVAIVTADEVVSMAEKAVLEAYRDSIRSYLAKTGGVYPWLFNYQGITYDPLLPEPISVAIDKLSDYFPYDTNWGTAPDYNADNGRIPSMFSSYFTDGSTSIPFEARLSGTIRLINPVSALDNVFFTETSCNAKSCPNTGSTNGVVTNVDGFRPLTLDPVSIAADDVPKLKFTANPVVNVNFEDLASTAGRVTVDFPALDEHTFEVYFWDEDNVATGTFTACPAGADELLDCSRSGSPLVPNFTHTPGATNGVKSRILHLTVKLALNGAMDFDVDYATPPTITVDPPTSNSHAKITAKFAAANVTAVPGVLSATYEFHRHWHENDPAIDTGDGDYSQGVVDMSTFSLGDLELEIPYYPELPRWTYDNGWHNAVRMAYAPAYRPDTLGACVVSPADDCLKINPDYNWPRDIKSLVVLASQHNWQDVGGDGWLGNSLDIKSVFDDGNHNGNYTYYSNRGNDRVLLIEELP